MTEYIYERTEEPAKLVRDGWYFHIEWDFVQREEIVRCRDCKWIFEDEQYGTSCRYWCRSLECLDGFCAWGIRKE